MSVRFEDENGELIDKKSINKSFHWACDQAINHNNKPSKDSLALINYLLLFKNGADVDDYEPTWGTTLRRAVGSRDSKLVQLLIAHGANIEASGSFGGSSPLMIAGSTGDVGILEILLDAGARLENQRGMAGNLIQTASFLGHEAVVR